MTLDEIYSYPNSDYIYLADFPDLSIAQRLETLVGYDETFRLAISFQTMPIQTFIDHVNSGKKEMDNEWQKEKEAKLKEFDIIGHLGMTRYEYEVDLEKGFHTSGDIYKASMLYLFNKVNRRNSDKAQKTPQEWEQIKYRTEYEVKAEEEWKKKMGSQSDLSKYIEGSVGEYELKISKVDSLAERFAKLPQIQEKHLNLQRMLAFNALLEAGYLQDAENVLIIYENLDDNMKRVLYGTSPHSLNQDLVK